MNVAGFEAVELVRELRDLRGNRPRFRMPGQKNGSLLDVAGSPRLTAYQWPGLSADDSVLLQCLIARLGDDLNALWVSVPVSVPDLPAGVAPGCAMARCFEAKWSRKIDAVLLIRGEWAIVELKPCAGPYALGQVLAYWGLGIAAWRELDHATAAVVTDVADADVRPIYEACGVGLVELGECLEMARHGVRRVPEITA
jgi:hypothetical protein